MCDAVPLAPYAFEPVALPDDCAWKHPSVLPGTARAMDAGELPMHMGRERSFIADSNPHHNAREEIEISA